VPEDIVIRPIGIVKSDYSDPKAVQDSEQKATIEVFQEYAGALLRIERNSHLWILTWFHLANRDVLSTVPYRVNPDSLSYGVFALRSPVRPNPIGLSLVKLDKVKGRLLYVSGLDAVNGTPVIDIKPYFENDIIFSPRTPYIRPLKRDMLQNIFLRQALDHHQEECSDLLMAVRMAVIASERFGHLNSPDLHVMAEGSPCLADAIQGLSRARLANPPRFEYRPADSPGRTVWRRGSKVMDITSHGQIDKDGFWELADSEVLEVSMRTL
jgi:tRNA-Thr(GGU) m(6)t(6)A37 methyltransferase TsaA